MESTEETERRRDQLYKILNDPLKRKRTKQPKGHIWKTAVTEEAAEAIKKHEKARKKAEHP